jgi:hypothetical protein
MADFRDILKDVPQRKAAFYKQGSTVSQWQGAIGRNLPPAVFSMMNLALPPARREIIAPVV